MSDQVRDSKTNFSAGAFSIALFAVGVLLWGCGGSGCGGGNCPPVGCPTPKEGLSDNILGHVAYGDTPTSDTIVASVGSDGDIYFQLTGSDPSQGPNWTSWADYFKLHPFGLHDWDQAVITFYPDASQNCNTSTTNYYLQDNKLSLQVTWDESDVVWEAGEHDMVMTLDDPGTQSLIGLPGCYSVEDPDKTITVTVHLWDAIVTGPLTLERAQEGQYEIKHDELPSSYVIGYLWDSTWSTGGVMYPENATLTQNNTWNGTIVTTTTVQCGMMVQPPFLGQPITVYPNITTTITPRNWTMSSPTIDEDYKDDWVALDMETGDPALPTMSSITCDQGGASAAILGELHNKDSGGRGFMFFPNAGFVGQVILKTPVGNVLNGPNKGLWYVSAADYEFNLGSVIDKWIRDGTLKPPTSTNNWYDENLTQDCFDDGVHHKTVGDFINSIKLHEANGNATGSQPNGHFAQLTQSLAADSSHYYDVRWNMESLLAESSTVILENIYDKLNVMNNRLTNAGDRDHTYVGGNWAIINGDTAGYNFSSWNPDLAAWGDSQPCNCYGEEPNYD